MCRLLAGRTVEAPGPGRPEAGALPGVYPQPGWVNALGGDWEVVPIAGVPHTQPLSVSTVCIAHAYAKVRRNSQLSCSHHQIVPENEQYSICPICANKQAKYGRLTLRTACKAARALTCM